MNWPFAPALMLLILAAASATAPPELTFLNRNIRSLGSLNFYRWTCARRAGPVNDVLGVITFHPPPAANDTFARFTHVAHCHSRAVTSTLQHLCRNDPARWVHVARRTLAHCLAAPLSADGKGIPGSMEEGYSRAACGPEFLGRIDGGRSDGVFICSCRQTQISVPQEQEPPLVVPASARFSTLATPGKSDSEREELRKCMQEAQGQTEDSCGVSSKDFDILGRHLMEACCKRVRTKFPESKFECRELVPDDLSAIQ